MLQRKSSIFFIRMYHKVEKNTLQCKNNIQNICTVLHFNVSLHQK